MKSSGGSGSGSSSSDIFKTLFGDVIEEDNSYSIFSNSNPFRRKATTVPQTTQQSGLVEAVENPTNADAEDVNHVSEPKKRKRSKEKKASSYADSPEEALVKFQEEKILKRKKALKPNLDKSNNVSIKDDLNSPTSELEANEMANNAEDKGPNLSSELNGAANSKIDGLNEGGGDGKKKKKKRKRDEIELEYEAKKYGELGEESEGGNLGGKIIGEKRKKMDNAAEMLVPKEGFDDENKLLRTVFVGNLPLKVKKKALLKEFRQFGEIESVRIRSVPILDTKTPRKGAILKKKINDAVDSVHAYIVFKTEESANASLTHNMAVIGENHIRVDRACPPRKKMKGESSPLYDNKRTVFLGNLPFDVKDEEIYQLLSSISNIQSSVEAIRVIRDPHTSVGKGIAYVLFKTREAANLVLRKQNFKLRGRDLRVCHAKSDSTLAKRKNPPHFTTQSPSKKLAFVDSTDSSSNSKSNNRPKPNASASYQGLRASKSGFQKKVQPKRMEPKKVKAHAMKGEKPKAQKTKRPAVAARKANGLKLKGAGGKNQAGKKRKLENRSPDSFRQNKKAKKFG